MKGIMWAVRGCVVLEALVVVPFRRGNVRERPPLRHWQRQGSWIHDSIQHASYGVSWKTTPPPWGPPLAAVP
jgi:hypothetical protein